MAIKFLNTVAVDADVLYVDASSNRVGVGTTSPEAKLDVESEILISGTDPILRMERGDGFNSDIIKVESSTDNIIIGDTSLDEMIFEVDTGEAMRITGGGNVGIGTTSPSQKLDVAGDARVEGRIYSNATALDSVGISGKAIANGWAARYDSNNANYSGFFFNTNNDASMYLRDDAGNTNVLLRSDSSSYFNGGNVGIGTTSPGAKLDISAGTNLNLGVRQLALDNFSNEGIGMTFSRTSSDADLMAIGVVSTDKLGVFSRSGIIFSTGGSSQYGQTVERMRIDNSGNVGIGATSPVGRLNVKNGSSGQSYSNVSGVLIDVYGSSNSFYGLRVGSNTGNDHLCVTNAGNVGIGTTSPGYKLEVDGTFSSNAIWTTSFNVTEWGSGTTAYGTLTWGTGYAKVFANSGNQLQLAAGGASTDMTIDTSGNVGIGTTSPQEKFVVNAGAITAIASDGAYTAGYFAKLSSDYGPNALKLTSKTGDIIRASDYGSSVSILTGNPTSVKMFINSAGNVGIGTTSPGSELDVSSSSTSIIRLSNSDTALTEGQKTGSLEFYQSDTSGNGTGVTGRISMSSAKNGENENYYGNAADMIFEVAAPPGFASDNATLNALTIKNSSGNVGIGTTNPGASLQVGSTVGANSLNLVLGKVDIVDVNKDITDIQAGTLNISSTSRSSSSPFNQGNGPSLTFTQNGSGYVDGYDKVIGGIKTEIKNAANLDFRSIMQFYTHNNSVLSPRMTIDNDGNVGIGTTSPAKKLHVAGDTQIDAGATGQTLLLGRANGQPSIKANTDNGGHLILDSTTNFMSLNHYVNKNVLLVAGGGNVGIGTTSPTEKLEVAGAIKMSENSSYPLTIDHNSATTTNEITTVGGLNIISGSNNSINFKDATTTNMSISGYSGDVLMGYNTGKVGIGTTSPSDKLTVENGNIRLNSTSSFPAQGLYAYWNNGSPNMGGISWHNNPGFIGSEWNHYKQSSPYTQSRIRLIGDANGGMYVNLNNSDVFSILASNGNVGIGNTSPSNSLVVGIGTSNSSDRSNTLLSETSTGGTANALGLVNSAYGAYGNATALNFHLSRTYSPTARIIAYQDGSSSQTDTGLKFFTYNGSLQQRMHIDHDGNVGIGTTSAGEKLEVNGHVKAVDGYKGYVSYFHNGGFFHSPRSTDGANPLWIPINSTAMSSSDQYYNTWVPLYAGRVRKIILKHISGSTPVATVCTFYKRINGTTSGTTYTGTVTGGGAVGMKVTFDFGTSNFTFNAEDEVQIGVVTGVATQPRMGGMSCQIWYEYNIT